MTKFYYVSEIPHTSHFPKIAPLFLLFLYRKIVNLTNPQIPLPTSLKLLFTFLFLATTLIP